MRTVPLVPTLWPKRLLLAFAVFALAVRALVPMGWMPSQSSAPVFEICSDGGPALAWVDETGKLRKDAPADNSAKHQHCAFASAAADYFTSPGAPQAASFEAEVVPVSYLAAAIGHGLAAPPPPQTGPPFLT